MNITTDQIKERVRVAVVTLQGLPTSITADHIELNTNWPLVIVEARATYIADQTARRATPTAQAVDDLSEVIGWMRGLDDRYMQIVWMVGEGQPWRVICERTGCLRGLVWKRYNTAITRMAQAARRDVVSGDAPERHGIVLGERAK